MGDVIVILASLVNKLHDVFLKLNSYLGFQLSDKDLHFWIFGFAGFVIFMVVDILFKRISRWNVSIISFIYTFTVMVIIALALEIMQKVTGRGNMEFLDFAYGVWGFIVFAGITLFIKITASYFKKRSYNHKVK